MIAKHGIARIFLLFPMRANDKNTETAIGLAWNLEGIQYLILITYVAFIREGIQMTL